MDETPSPPRPRRPWGRTVGLLLAGIVAGAIMAGTMAAGADTPSSASTATTATASAASGSGSSETALTGTTAQKVRAAALAAVPGGTIIRVETSRDGSSYEAHVRKADGTRVVVLMDKSFHVTSVETDHCEEDSSSA